MSTLPLISRHRLDDILAWTPAGPRTVRDFLADARALAARLPAGRTLLNVCHDRYRYAVGFAAGALSGRVSLQPASLSAETLSHIRADYPDVVCLCDGDYDGCGLPRYDFPELPDAAPHAIAAIPALPVDQRVAILFTSGSTGLPQAHSKHWGKLVAGARAEAAALGLDATPHAIVGTVPVQHSYGFESTFLLALHGGCTFWSGKPFYPQDIVHALAAVPRPRLLVSTPFHLATLLAADVNLPPFERIVSATATLGATLAATAEARTGAVVQEIYGSTESGQLACRRTLDGAAWTLLPEVVLEQDGETTRVDGGHVETQVALGDRIECLPDGRFVLHGRHADLVNIAGKRTSLAYLNHQIGSVPGVVDAAFFLPDEDVDAAVVTRLAAFVVAPGLDRARLLTELRARIDAIFLPRPLVLVDALPRNSTGKLPRSALAALYRAQVAHGAR